MFGFKRGAPSGQDFWSWFVANLARFQAFAENPRTNDPLLNDLKRRLAKVHDGLAFEIGQPSEGGVELIVSAEGLKSAFPAVIQLVEAAPKIEGLKVTAFRPRQPGVQLRTKDKTFTLESFSYVAARDGQQLSLRLFSHGNVPAEHFKRVGFLLLDKAIGEYDVATGLSSIAFEADPPPDAKPLSALAEEFDQFRAQTVQ